MAHNDDTRNAVRASYVLERLDLKSAAKKHGVSYPTVNRWKVKALEQGDNWDLARNAARQTAGVAGDLTLQMLEDFAIQYQSVMTEVREDKKMTALVKVEILTKLGDSYSKVMSKAAGNDNKIGKLAVSIDTLKLLSTFVQKEAPELLEPFMLLLDRFSPELTKHYG